MSDGFSGLEGIFVQAVLTAVILIGALALAMIYWPAGLGGLIVVLFLWYYLHRIRLCNHCDKRCPYRPAKKNERNTRVGFNLIEAVIFYPTFIVIMGAFIVAIFYLNLYLGIIASVLLAIALILYRIRICRTCRLPCPIRPKTSAHHLKTL